MYITLLEVEMIPAVCFYKHFNNLNKLQKITMIGYRNRCNTRKQKHFTNPCLIYYNYNYYIYLLGGSAKMLYKIFQIVISSKPSGILQHIFHHLLWTKWIYYLTGYRHLLGVLEHICNDCSWICPSSHGSENINRI